VQERECQTRTEKMTVMTIRERPEEPQKPRTQANPRTALADQ
jgi:hypothetical protein